MPKKGYSHLTYEQRWQIYALLKRDLSNKEIGETLKVDSSTIDKEIARNRGKRGYRPKQAQRKAEARRRYASGVPRKMTPKIKCLIKKLLIEQQWSPEQISGRLKLQHMISISPKSIYAYIEANRKNGGTLYKHLRRRGKKNNKRKYKGSGKGLIPNRTDISQRPKIVEKKKRIGDFEVDTIVGAHHQGAAVSIVDRKSKLTLLARISRTTAKQTTKALIQKLKAVKKYVHTITSDNGKEFAYHQIVAKKLKANFYFAQPYHSWERGLNENTNGLVRQYLPKKTSFANITDKQIRCIQNKLNNRPRKTLGFRTPLEIFLKLTSPQLVAALRK